MNLKKGSFSKLRKLFQSKKRSTGDDKSTQTLVNDELDNITVETCDCKKQREPVYHEMDFSLKNPVLFSSNSGDILVRSKFASKPPLVPRLERNKKTKSHEMRTESFWRVSITSR